VTFVSVPWVIICVRLDPSTHLICAQGWPLNPSVTLASLASLKSWLGSARCRIISVNSLSKIKYKVSKKLSDIFYISKINIILIVVVWTMGPWPTSNCVAWPALDGVWDDTSDYPGSGYSKPYFQQRGWGLYYSHCGACSRGLQAQRERGSPHDPRDDWGKCQYLRQGEKARVRLRVSSCPMEGPLPNLYTKGSVRSETESFIRRRDALASDVTTNHAVDSCLLTSHREPKLRGCSYARPLRERPSCRSGCKQYRGIGQRLLTGRVIVLACDDVEIPCNAHRDQSPCFCWCRSLPEALAEPSLDARYCWGLVLKCYESRTRQHKMLNINVLRPSKHYFPKGIIIFGRRAWRAYLHHVDIYIYIYIYIYIFICVRLLTTNEACKA
jgi:hypothetical protein